MDTFFLSAKIILGVVFVLLYILVLQPWAVSLFYKLIQRGWYTRTANMAEFLFISCSLLLLPLAIPRFLSIVRLFYAMMAITLLQKLVSYLREHGWPGSPVEPQKEYFDFMDGYTTNYLERAAQLEETERAPDPHHLRWWALVKYGVIAAAMVLNITLDLWRYTPPLGATLIKALFFILALSATQDMVRAGQVGRGLRPDVTLVDLRLFWSPTYQLVMLRTNPIVHKWLLRYVYIPLGGNTHPLRNTMACYLLSGLWYEYILSIASMKVCGLWFAYFAVNGIIVCVERALSPYRASLFKRFGEGSIRYRALELALPIGNFVLNVCVAHLLFLGLDKVIRFH